MMVISLACLVPWALLTKTDPCPLLATLCNHFEVSDSAGKRPVGGQTVGLGRLNRRRRGGTYALHLPPPSVRRRPLLQRGKAIAAMCEVQFVGLR